MSGYKDLEIYRISKDIAFRVHKESLKMPQFELYEQGAQVRRSTKSIRDTISEGYGRRRYKAELIKFLVYAQASCDEASGQVEGIIEIYPDLEGFKDIYEELDKLGKKINKFIDYIDNNWRS
jgi:four helix bundle protein